MGDVLHLRPISQRILYHSAAFVTLCVLGCAPSYLYDLHPVSDVTTRRVLRSATRGDLLIPQSRLTIMQRHALRLCYCSSRMISHLHFASGPTVKVLHVSQVFPFWYWEGWKRLGVIS